MISGSLVGCTEALGKLQAVNNSKIPVKNKNGRRRFNNIDSSFIKYISLDANQGDKVPNPEKSSNPLSITPPSLNIHEIIKKCPLDFVDITNRLVHLAWTMVQPR
jgi:hypothetical protein